ncbi:MAG: sulfotransferase family protein [Gammaproteobacteria bacterium]|nr:sulfotransferase family protein [Gammaproteobacteria bacterium]
MHLRAKAERVVRVEGYSFSFVRHPWTRLVSTWADKVLRDKPQWGFPEVGITQYMELADFVEKVCAAPRQCDCHIRPQAWHIPVDTWCGRVENIELDWERVMLRTGLPRLERCKTSDHRPPFEYLTRDLRAMVSKRFADDFKRWKYEWPM